LLGQVRCGKVEAKTRLERQDEALKLREEVEKVREKKGKAKRKRDCWWTTEDIEMAAEVLSMNVSIMEAKPASRRTSTSYCQYGSTEEEIVTIFGGNDLQGGHWTLLSEDFPEATSKLPGVKRKGKLTNIWSELKYEWRKTPEEVQSRRRIEETIDVDRQEMESSMKGENP